MNLIIVICNLQASQEMYTEKFFDEEAYCMQPPFKQLHQNTQKEEMRKPNQHRRPLKTGGCWDIVDFNSCGLLN